MAIFQTNNEDVPIWKLSRDGKYLVKSAYYYILWRLLLITMIYVKLQIGPLFGLFIILNVWNLIRKGVPCLNTCPYCELNLENEWHIFFGCDQALTIWRNHGLWPLLHPLVSRAESTKDCIFLVLNNLIGVKVDKFTSTIWALWKMRNEKVWNHAELPIPYTLQSAMQSIREWQRARIAPLSANVFSIAQHDTRWYSPPIGNLKCNLGTTIFNDDHNYGISTCIWNHSGQVAVEMTDHFHNLTTPQEQKQWLYTKLFYG